MNFPPIRWRVEELKTPTAGCTHRVVGELNHFVSIAFNPELTDEHETRLKLGYRELAHALLDSAESVTAVWW